MRHPVGAIALAMALGGCSQPPDVLSAAAAYRGLGDRMKVYFAPFLGAPCGSSVLYGRSVATVAETCFRFGERRRMSGVLVTSGYGPAMFFENLARQPRYEIMARSAAAISGRYHLHPTRVDGVVTNERAFTISFVGRETARGGGRYLSSVVIIDRIERLARLPAARREPERRNKPAATN